MVNKNIIEVEGKRYVLEDSLNSYRLNNLVVNTIILLSLFMLVFYYVSVITSADEFSCKYNGLVCEFISYPDIPQEDIGEICLLKPHVIGSIGVYEERERRGFENDFDMI